MLGEIVSHYRILNEIGGGGMGVVYRAEDVRLGREVALKFLPATLARQREALDRFLREARMASALNHPNICTIHDIGTSDEHGGQPFIVMELLEGATLKHTIGGRPVPVDRLLEVAVQIGEALEAAHRRGIVHRDIKPANVFVTRTGHVKVLDFGLAKLAQDRGGFDSDASSSATTASESIQEITKPGLQVGTMAYMSPEQARGEAVDARTDLFSFGVVLYEMATGRRAFPGTNSAVIFDAILNRAPEPPYEYNPGVPDELVRIIDKAIEKDRDLRYQNAADLVADLRRLQRSLDPERSSTVLTVLGTRTPSPITPYTSATATAAPARRVPQRLAWALGSLLVLAAVAGLGWYAWHARQRPLSDRDSIMLGDVQNRTGEAVFDGTLRQALAVQLGQSPFLDILGDDRVRETLARMGRPPDEPLSEPVAREVCQRQGLKAMIHGSIARLGTVYVVSLEGLNCETGDAIARQQGEAGSQERVLATVGTLARSLRVTLGESLASIDKYHTPIEVASTRSLEALRAYTLAVAQRARGAEIEAIPFFERAIELDPKFTSAHTMLSTVYGNLGETARSEEFARKAYALREQVSERERLLVTFQYHDRVTGDLEQVISSLNVWKQSFPRDYTPANALVVILNRLGRFEAAIPNGEEAIRRNPSHGFPYSNLAHTYRALGRYDEAKATAERAVALKVETLPTRRLLYQLALMKGDREEAARHRAWARDRTREFDFVGAEAQVAGFHGHLTEARALYRRAIEMAAQHQLGEIASGYRAQAAMVEAVIANRPGAETAAREVLGQHPTDVPKLRAAASLALVGSPAAAAAAVRETTPRYPSSTTMNGIYLPMTAGAAALGERRPDQALEALRAAAPYDFGLVSSLVTAYLRAQALLQKGNGADAAGEFQRIIDHRGTDPFSILIPLSHLGLARAYQQAGDRDKSRAAYEAFFDLWKDADADIPVLIAARREAAGGP